MIKPFSDVLKTFYTLLRIFTYLCMTVDMKNQKADYKDFAEEPPISVLTGLLPRDHV